ncbi:MAG: DUF2892 domain-containing protein [Halobacteriales archaeon]
MIDENVGGTDRLFRIGFGGIAVFIGVAVLALLSRPGVGGALLLIGTLLLGTALARRCPINRALNVDTDDRD